jgi:hypothetical protein
MLFSQHPSARVNNYVHLKCRQYLYTVWLFLLCICYTVIHRKLQNVVYMKKKIDVKQKGGMGNQRHHSLWHRVLSTSTCGSDQFNLDIWLYNLCNFIILSMQNKLSWEKHIGHRQKIIRSVFILMLINKVYEKFHNHFIENLITTPLGHIKKMHIYKY